MTGTSATEPITQPASSGFVYGTNSLTLALNDIATEIAPTGIPILIVGESGTGKDAYARLLHRLSKFQDAPFHKIDCPSCDPNQVSSLLSAARHKHSLGARFGTLYLDNVHELDLVSQRVLVSMLQDDDSAEFSGEIPFRFVSSTSINLEKEVEAGRFRRELYFRLNGICLRLIPLRNRTEDIPALVEYFFKKHSRALGKSAPHLSSEQLGALASFAWPGNIRELENLIRQIVVFGNANTVMKNFEMALAEKADVIVALKPTSLKVAARAASEKAERSLILEALERTHWNRKRAARDLQISYKSLLYKIKQIGVSNEEEQKES